MRLRENEEQFLASVDFKWLWNLKPALGKPNHKIIYLFRNAEHIAASFMTYIKQVERPYSTYMAYPICGPAPTFDFIYRSVREYQQHVSLVKSLFQDQFVTLHIDDLNNLDRMMELLTWLGYPKEGRIETLHRIRSWKKD